MVPCKGSNKLAASHFQQCEVNKGQVGEGQDHGFVSVKSHRSCSFFPLSATRAISAHTQCGMMSCRAPQQGRQNETHTQISRQTDQEAAELSMQRIAAVTSCDHRRSRRQGGEMRRRWRGRRMTGVGGEGRGKKKKKQVRRGVEVCEGEGEWKKREGINVPHAIYTTLNYPLLQPRRQQIWRR